MASGAELAMILRAKDEASGVFDHVKGSAGGMTSGISSMISGLGGVGLALGGIKALGETVAGAATAMIGGNVEMEKYETQLGTLLGGADKAKDRIQQLAKIGAETPFDLPQLVAAEKIMAGFGLTTEKTQQLTGRSLDEYRRQIGDMAAATGAPLDEVTLLWSKFGSGATGEAISRLQELGIVTREQMQGMGIEFSKSGELVSPVPEAMRVAMDLANQKMGGGMKALSATFDGQMSTLSDNFNQAKVLLAQPIFEVLKGGLTSLNEALSSETFTDTIKSMAETGAAAIKSLIEVFGGLIDIFRGGGEFGKVGEMLANFFPSAVVINILGMVAALGDTFRAVFAGDIPTAIGTGLLVLENLGGVISGLVEDWASTFAGWVDGADSELIDNLGDMAVDIQGWVFDTGLAIVEKLGTWAAAFIDWVAPKIPGLIRELGGFLAKMLEWAGGTALPTLAEKLVEWGTAFVEWIAPKIAPMLVEAGKLLLELGGWLLGTALPAIVSKLAEWAGAFISWVLPMIPKLLLELGKLELEFLGWIVGTALPSIVSKLLEWGAAFAAWVAPALVNLLLELGKLEIALIGWVGEKVAEIVSKLVEWGGAFLGWVAKDVIPTLPEKLGAILTAITGWVGEKVGSVVESVKSIGSGILQGIQNGISGALSGFWSWLQTSFVDKIPEFVRNLLNIHSPSGVFADIGRNMIEGLRVGMEQRLPSVQEMISRALGGVGGSVGGNLDDWLQAAISATGVSGSWLPGLRWIVEHESGGDPHAKNPHSTASGLFQMIDTTWAASRDKSLPNDIWNPIINAIAGIRYIGERYGNPGNAVDFWKANNHYAAGGWAGLHGPELAWLGERGPEYVVSNSSLQGGSAGRGAGGTQVIEHRIRIGDLEAMRIVVVGTELKSTVYGSNN